MIKILMCAILASLWSATTMAQQTPNEARVALSERAIALDATNASALEATLSTRGLNGAPDTPVTNIRMIVRTRLGAYAFVWAS